MDWLTKDKRNFIRLAFLLASISSLYWQLNKIGYIPPINYWVGKNNIDRSIKPSPSSTELLNYGLPLSNLVDTPIDLSQTDILIEKSNYKLTLFYQDRPTKSYPIVLGGSPVGDKLREGDYKTPEGIFKVRDLYPHSQWSKFIWLDYPNQESWRKHLAAKKSGKIELSDTIGSEIGIHGVPKNNDSLIDRKTNWTWGCISLKNQDVDELYGAIQVGTTITIVP